LVAVRTREASVPILIAEDNDAQRHYLRERITAKFPDHLPVLEAGDGESAVRIALSHRPVLSVFAASESNKLCRV
jgi:hypothetical protein